MFDLSKHGALAQREHAGDRHSSPNTDIHHVLLDMVLKSQIFQKKFHSFVSQEYFINNVDNKQNSTTYHYIALVVLRKFLNTAQASYNMLDGDTRPDT
ncbi:hypothetical protein E2C01_050829 [Portunus trituberculatus]|uniref:Uncharacterized protein n=1 Tax=Portunus trituberculatus TaxID=210409 RepID=A0A5B7GHI5_PORTR|nr:hypothetical protein [Portunus trituberculatus]